MNTTTNLERKKASLPVAVFLSALLTLPVLSGCGGGSRTAAPLPPVDDTAGRNVGYPQSPNQPQQTKRGLTTGQKVAITLVGAAALYYLYNQRKNARGNGAQGKYYLSKNGRVYYRDDQGRPHWVTPPSEGIRVPESQAQQYRDFKGYNGRTTGRDLTDIAPQEAPTY
ncbi:hypothetical protein [Brasilonema bromeliae]|uniref:Lipoprotein n=1 Tax=Brasilonema bromeliae SPC951 TaxID=385972 RepID=A0ABX1P347_9CYAN|nr:hypothetical protein [Brasilonema bromeliae]NMG18756.1 hypothetical protein [Brasilonema bromeliae SPC951]